MKKRIIAVLLCAALVSGLCACGSSEAEKEETQASPAASPTQTGAEDETVVIENFGITTTYEKAPASAVALSYSIAEIMVAMGLKDKIVADAASMYMIDQVSEKYRAEVASIPELEGNYGVPTLETVLDTDAEFVFGDSYSFMARNVGEPADFEKAGVKIYATEGTYVDNPTLENVYNDILNIGKIFRVEEQAEELVLELRTREAAVAANVEALSPVTVFYLDSDDGEGTFASIGNTGYQIYLLERAGCKNIFDDVDGEYIDVSREQVIERDPEYILVVDYYGSGYAEEKIQDLKNSADMGEMEAVKNDRFIIVSGLAVFPSLESVDFIEELAEAVHP